MKSTYIIVVLAAVMLFGAACGQKDQRNTNATAGNRNTTTSQVNTSRTGSFTTTSTDNQSVQVVTLSSAGLDKPAIRIRKGDRVEFRNGDTAQHTVASDPHPTHTDLPGFDLRLVPGGTASFTFLRAGTFTYHDHDRPENATFKGEVIVEE